MKFTPSDDQVPPELDFVGRVSGHDDCDQVHGLDHVPEEASQKWIVPGDVEEDAHDLKMAREVNRG